MTEAGLNPVNLSTLNTWQQIMLLFLIMLGSSIWVSAFVVHIRRKAFETRFREEIEREQRDHGGSRWFPLSRSRSWAPSVFPGPRIDPNPEPLTSDPEPATIDQRLEDSSSENKAEPSPSADNVRNEKPVETAQARSDADELISPLSDVPTAQVETNRRPVSNGYSASPYSQPQTDREANRSG